MGHRWTFYIEYRTFARNKLEPHNFVQIRVMPIDTYWHILHIKSLVSYCMFFNKFAMSTFHSCSKTSESLSITALYNMFERIQRTRRCNAAFNALQTGSFRNFPESSVDCKGLSQCCYSLLRKKSTLKHTIYNCTSVYS